MHVDKLVEDFFAAGNERLPLDVWRRRYGYDTAPKTDVVAEAPAGCAP